MDSGAEDDGRSRNLDFDHASVKSLEETQQSWLLEPTTKKKAKQIDLGCMVCSRKLFMIIVYVLLGASVIVGLSVIIWKFAPRKHHRPPPLDNYTIALQKALKFFDAQKCEYYFLGLRFCLIHPYILRSYDHAAGSAHGDPLGFLGTGIHVSFGAVRNEELTPWY